MGATLALAVGLGTASSGAADRPLAAPLEPASTAAPAADPAPTGAAARTTMAAVAAAARPTVLVFHGSAARQEDAVAAAARTVRQLGTEHGFATEVSEDPAIFAGDLSRFRSVVFLSNVGAELTGTQLAGLRTFVHGGGGFLGIHDAAKAQAGNAWFTELVGARPTNSPFKPQQATVSVLDRQHPAGRGLDYTFEATDRWTNWQTNPLGSVHTVAQVEENTYAPAAGQVSGNGPFHPISWCQDVQRGRSFYTGMGATAAAFDNDDFRTHLAGAVQWTAGMVRGDCQATIADNYEVERLTAPNQAGQLDQIGESHGITVAPGGDVFYVGKAACPSGPIASWDDPDVGLGCGTIHRYDPETGGVSLLTTLEVMGNRGSGDELVKNEEGLLGIVADPDFADNNWLYTYWMPHDSIDRERRVGLRTISRFTYDPATDTIDQGTRVDLLQWETQIHSCCHAGGGMAFDSDGNLYIGSGDSNSSGGSEGYSGNNWTEDYEGLSFQDARRTSGNTNDLNGKVIRIRPEDDGTYSIPAGNLFTGDEEGGGKTRPEIYVMGVRNISRLQIDTETDWLTAGWVGPDASEPSTTWGPAKYETATVITSAGNQGWPYCMGNKQPYRDRSNDDATQPAEWYDCDDLQNTSPRNTGLVDIPDARANMIWYSPSGGGPVYPERADGSGVPTYEADEQTFTQPYLKGGGQAVMSGPTFRGADVDPDSDVSWPSYWEGKWLIGDQSNANNRIAVTVDPGTVAQAGPPAFAEDLRQIIPGGTGPQQLQSWMDAKFGEDGALYLLDYGGGFFSLHPNQKLIRIVYKGGPATPTPAQMRALDDADVRAAAAAYDAAPITQATPTRYAFQAPGGTSWAWDFGDGTTSNRMNPAHTFTEGGEHEVSLTVGYADGEQATSTATVDVTCEAPDARETVWFLDDDTGVFNLDVGGGCTLNDVVDDESAWGSQAEFAAYVKDLTRRMVADRSINAIEKRAMERAAITSGVGVAPSYTPIFDGSAASFAKWEQAPSGSFTRTARGTMTTAGGLGMLWYAEQPFGDFTVRLQFKDNAPDGFRANTGVFTRFPDLRTPLEERPAGSCGTVGSARTSAAWVAIYCGHEIQIYDGDTGEVQKTGSVYNFDPVGLAAARPTPKGQWNDYEIRVQGQQYTISRNGVRINTFTNSPGLASSRAGDPPTDMRQFLSGYLGLQNHSDNDAAEFRNIRVQQR
ncbi:ThuA domain-containing protein [Nocardioides sp. C4-1]|uniref:ThuA domain-containing protein n=1 Tax=Nocardioides sp. C4-1 TaxID=3151851 RepID=UPI0032660F46